MDQWNVWRSAEEMIRRYGEFDAVTVSIRRELRFRKQGDEAIADVWHRIGDAVEALAVLSCDCIDHENARGIIFPELSPKRVYRPGA